MFWSRMSPNRRSEIVGVGILTIALILLLSLVSYDPEDFLRPEHLRVNWIGTPGAYIAKGLFSAVGWSGFLAPLLLIYWGIRWFQGKKQVGSVLSLSGAVILILSLCTLFSILEYGDSSRMFAAGGVAGSYAAERMMIFGPVGSYLILCALVLIAILLSTEFLFTPVLVRAWKKIVLRLRASKNNLREIRTNIEPIRAEPLGRKKKKKKKKFGEDEKTDFMILAEEKAGEEEDSIFPRIISAEAPAPVHTRLKPERKLANFKLPSLSLFTQPRMPSESLSREEVLTNSEILERTLAEFDISAKVVEVNHGPVITRYELEPPPGVKIARISGLSDNLALALRATHVRIVAPIPGKAAVGVEIPNRNRCEVLIREIMSSDAYRSRSSLLKIAMGKTISGEPFVADLAKMPHLLIAGATGSGKSVCVNSIIASFLLNASPDEVKFLMIDPKRVELKMYSDIPHMLAPVVTEPKRAAAALRWVVEEMEDRYRFLSKARVRDINEYNKKQEAALKKNLDQANPTLPSRMPYIVVIIDELADLMMVARGEIEGAVARLAQMARAVGIHLVLATQRPSVNIITGVIKANFPTRIAFQVSSKVDSRTILDCNGAETLLGRGDMLFSFGGASKPVRIQGSLVSTEEIEALTDFIKAQQKVEYLQEDFDAEEEAGGLNEDGLAGDDEVYREALELVMSTGSASTSLLQRRLKIGYGRAARLLDEMEQQGIVGPPRGSKPREVLAGR
jgi:DNA segregation ATPase FtsK/SpoIIIE, S-DNA-T family